MKLRLHRLFILTITGVRRIGTEKSRKSLYERTKI